MSEVDHLIRRIKGLVRVRELLRNAGATDEQLERQSQDIRRLQARLAERVRQTMRDTAS